ncbi:CCA-adding enzyme [Sedimentisphaera cyanobacteriorum]|uniref:CCA-adding enzyme n=1 Tax=Sedimentisphaera cyanobacteriorum TaxID=1940790 RepID=A0A1Q2HNB7_9BACT|nr:hypothetical protein [Sedimentisphaera cyanobacteriorum]AQQ09039.1 CCA-adding enzyme [Sedimentisphaera cyanobacteriorum]
MGEGKNITARKAAFKVLKTLRDNGFTAFYAGGCVRDMLIGREPKDYDIASDARPDEVERLFRRTVSVGAQFGVVLVMIKEHQIEVAAFRSEWGYTDGRRPDSIIFTDPEEDAKRRDFTINGLFFDPVEEEVFDYVGGREDIEKGIIRTIGNPQERFEEDYLRMLRAVRFSAELGFEIEPQTLKAVSEFSEKISRISSERIAVELEKIFLSPRPAVGIKLLIQTGLSSGILQHNFTEDSRGVCLLKFYARPVSLEMGILMLFMEDWQKAAQFARKLKLSSKSIQLIEWCRDNFYLLDFPDMALHKFRKLIADERFEFLFELKRAFQSFSGDLNDNLKIIKERQDEFEGKEILPAPLINGKDLLDFGLSPGPEVGGILEKVYHAQLDLEVNTRLQALSLAEKLVKS